MCVQRLNFLHCVLAECNCKKHEVCHEGECKCEKGYKMNKHGHCASQTGTLCIWSLYKTKNVVNFTQAVLILYAISRTFALGGCVHITSGSQNQAVLPKEHDYSSIFFFAAKALAKRSLLHKPGKTT